MWRHTWRKKWVNCAALTGNSAGLITVLSSRLSHRELRSSLRESHTHSVQFFVQFFTPLKCTVWLRVYGALNTPPAIPPSLHPCRFAHLAATIEESDCSQLGPPGTITEYWGKSERTSRLLARGYEYDIWCKNCIYTTSRNLLSACVRFLDVKGKEKIRKPWK